MGGRSEEEGQDWGVRSEKERMYRYIEEGSRGRKAQRKGMGGKSEEGSRGRMKGRGGEEGVRRKG